MIHIILELAKSPFFDVIVGLFIGMVALVATVDRGQRR